MSDSADSIQEVLRRLVGGSPRLAAHREKMQSLEKQIGSDDESEQLIGLSELCNMLNMATEDILVALRPDHFVPAIIGCLKKEHNIELMLLSARVLTYMMDSIPPTASVVVGCDGLGVLCDRLRNIVDIEVAEQVLTALSKVARESPGSVLEVDGVQALLGFIDFFNIAVQRKAFETVSVLCRSMTPTHFSHLVSSLPILRNYVQHEDAKLAESAAFALAHAIEGVREKEDLVVQAFGDLAEGDRCGARAAGV